MSKVFAGHAMSLVVTADKPDAIEHEVDLFSASGLRVHPEEGPFGSNPRMQIYRNLPTLIPQRLNSTGIVVEASVSRVC